MSVRPYRKAHLWRLCPYSTAASEDSRIPDGEKTSHTTTSGTMRIISNGRFICDSDTCSFYTGAASTPIYWKRWDGCTQTVISGTISPQTGTRFIES